MTLPGIALPVSVIRIGWGKVSKLVGDIPALLAL